MTNFARWRTLAASATLGLVAGLPLAATVASPAAAAAGDIRITEYMYDGTGGEWVELTNVGDAPIDLTGWRYDDDSASYGAGFDLSGFGTVAAGESVVFTETSAASFRTAWDQCAAQKVLGGYTNNLGRNDQINIFDGSQQLVDRLTYGDQNYPGTIRTTGRAGWVSAAGLGADDPAAWTLATAGDGEGSITSTNGTVGSPGASTRATVAFDPCAPPGQIRITEWMYDGSGGEWVELTNVGGAPVDLTGWRYDDDSRSYASGFDLGGFGAVAAGESVVFTEANPTTFRATWDLCAEQKVIGPYSNNLGRNDEINVFDGSQALVDRLTYGDENFPGTIRTTGRAGWVSAAGLGANDPAAWTLATAGDGEGSYPSSSNTVGSPGTSTRATVTFDACDEGPAPEVGVSVEPNQVAGHVGGDNPTAELTLVPADPETDASDLIVTAASSNDGVLPDAGVQVSTTGAERVVTFAPTGRGTSTVTFMVEDPHGGEGTATLQYASSNAVPDPSGLYFHTISDASSALEVGDGHALLLNDETNTVFLFETGASGLPVKTWNFTPTQLGTSDEIDIEGVARSGDTLVFTGSHGNNRDGEVRTERRTMFAATITGSGASTELTFTGRYDGLWSQLRTWDQSNGHGLGADALDLVAGSAPGVLPNAPDGFNVEGLEFGPDGTTGYLGFRAPTVNVGGEEHALVVPVTNLLALNTGTPGTTPATFGAPILLDLDGRSIRELRRNEHDEYLISAGPSPSNGTWALYTWDGDPAHDAAFNRELPAEDLLTGGTWETIVSVPHPLEAGALVQLVTDSGDTNFYGTGATKDLARDIQKSYAQTFALADVPVPTHELTVTLAGTGTGSVTGTGISCPGDCTETVVEGTSVTLTASPAGGSTFAGWSGGGCTGTGGCVVVVGADTTVTATFTVIPTHTLTVTKAGTGTGSVTGPGINCPGDCTEVLTQGASVTLTAIPAAGSRFTGWSGACTGTATTCTVSMTQAQSVTATFTVNPPPPAPNIVCVLLGAVLRPLLGLLGIRVC